MSDQTPTDCTLMDLDDAFRFTVNEDGTIDVRVAHIFGNGNIPAEHRMGIAAARTLRDRLTRAIIVAEVWHTEDEKWEPDAAE